MQQAFVPFPRDGILGLSEIENYRSIFNDYGIMSASQKIFDRAYQ